MSNEEKKKPAPTIQSVIPVSLRGTEIAIRKVRFRDATDLPARSVTEGLEVVIDEKRPGGPRYEIVLVPQMRQYVIGYYAPEREPEFMYVHEAQVKTSVPA